MLTGENRNTASATLFIILIIFCNSILLCYVSQLRKWCEMLCGGGCAAEIVGFFFGF
jgi:hypothetical protein